MLAPRERAIEAFHALGVTRIGPLGLVEKTLGETIHPLDEAQLAFLFLVLVAHSRFPLKFRNILDLKRLPGEWELCSAEASSSPTPS